MRICECSRPALHNQVPHLPAPALCHGEAGPFDAKRLAAVRQAPWYGVCRPLVRHDRRVGHARLCTKGRYRPPRAIHAVCARARSLWGSGDRGSVGARRLGRRLGRNRAVFAPPSLPTLKPCDLPRRRQLPSWGVAKR